MCSTKRAEQPPVDRARPGRPGRWSASPRSPRQLYNAVCIVVNDVVHDVVDNVVAGRPRGEVESARRCVVRYGCKDVAERAGVSVKTVSNVVNGYQHVVAGHPGAGRRRCIDETRLPAQPRPPAACAPGAPASSRWPCPSWTSRTSPSWPGYVVAGGRRARLDRAHRPDRRAARAGARGRRAASAHHLIDGLIFSPVALDGRRPGRPRPRRTSPLVLLGERVDAGPADHVAIDNVAAARAATEHLLALGPHADRRHRAPAGQRPASPGVAGCGGAGWEEALAAAGLRSEPRLVGRGPDASGAGPTARRRWPTLLDRGAAAGRGVLLQRHPGARGACGCWPTAGCGCRRTSR